MPTKNFGSKLFYTFFLTRRAVLAGLIVYCIGYPNLQIMMITFSTSVQVIYIGLTSPYEFKWMNRLELCNEYLILLSCTFLFAYSDGLLLMKNPGYPNPEFPEYDEALPDMESKF